MQCRTIWGLKKVAKPKIKKVLRQNFFFKLSPTELVERFVGAILEEKIWRDTFFVFLFLGLSIFSKLQIVILKILENFPQDCLGLPSTLSETTSWMSFPIPAERRHYRATKEHRDKVSLVVKCRGLFSFFLQLSSKKNFKRTCDTLSAVEMPAFARDVLEN